MILETLAVGPFESNCYVVGDESTKEGFIIDPGDEAKRILNKIKDLQLNIKLIVLTHGHMDHVGALKEVKEALGTEVAIHTEDGKLLLNHAQSLMAMMGFSFPTPPPADKLLKGGDIIDAGSFHFTVLHTPGHTPGGICLLGHGVVFTGDTLFNYGIGRTDFAGGSLSQIMDSIHTKLMTLPDETVVLPGHGPDSTIGIERKGNPFLKPGAFS